MDYWKTLRELNSQNFEQRRTSYIKLLSLLSVSDINSRKTKRVIKKLKKMDSSESRLLLKSLEDPLKAPQVQYFRQVVRNTGVCSKEAEEAIYFFNAVYPIFSAAKKISHISDACAGNGLASIYWNMHSQNTRFTQVDIRKNSHYNKLIRAFGDKINSSNMHYVESDLNYLKKHKTDAIIAIHPCGDLSDRVMDIAIDKRIPFALTPCCHQKGSHLPEDITRSMGNLENITDAIRIKEAINRGYDMHVREMPKNITKKNRIIIGLPN